MSELEGSWELVRIVAGPISNDLAPGNSYWYFTGDGKMCSLWRTAYGTYYNGNPGQVTQDVRQLIAAVDGGEIVYDLTCWADKDSMGLAVVSPDTLLYDMLYFHRVSEAPEATCFGGR